MMDDPTQPQLQLDDKRVICHRHCEPFRRNWPCGYSVFAIKGLQMLLADEDTQKEFELDPITNRRKLDNLKLGMLLEYVPICCRLKPGKLVELYQLVQDMAHPWIVAECSECENIRLGCEYFTFNFKRRLVRHGQVCFECVVYKMSCLWGKQRR